MVKKQDSIAYNKIGTFLTSCMLLYFQNLDRELFCQLNNYRPIVKYSNLEGLYTSTVNYFPTQEPPLTKIIRS